MLKHLEKDIENLKNKVITMGGEIEDRVVKATLSIIKRDEKLANSVIEADRDIDKMEVDIEEHCLKILALYQPVAVDLRFLIAVIKINNDLERIGDQAVNIAERVEVTSKRELQDFFYDYTAMGENAQTMLKMSLDALVNMDYDQALEVVKMDDSVDQSKSDAYDRIKTAMGKHPDKIGRK